MTFWLWSGQLHSSSIKNDGPVNHLEFSVDDSGTYLVALSAGFRVPGTKRHELTSVVVRISLMRFITNTGNFRFSFKIYFKTISESVQNLVLRSMEKLLAIDSLILVAKTAACNSNFGIVRDFGFNGATLNFPITNVTLTVCVS